MSKIACANAGLISPRCLVDPPPMFTSAVCAAWNKVSKHHSTISARPMALIGKNYVVTCARADGFISRPIEVDVMFCRCLSPARHHKIEITAFIGLQHGLME